MCYEYKYGNSSSYKFQVEFFGLLHKILLNEFCKRIGQFIITGKTAIYQSLTKSPAKRDALESSHLLI